MRIRVSPTRMQLLRLRRRTELARRGHKLLKDKLDGLVQKFYGIKNKYLSLYEKMEPRLVRVFFKSIMASSLSSPDFSEMLSTSELNEARNGFSEILPELIELTSLSRTLRTLASQIIETRRRVNALEYILIPELERNLKFIRMKLAELERGTRVVLLKIAK